MESYVTEAEVVQFADARGLSFPVDVKLQKQRILLATELFESYENKFKGIRTDPDQELSWPRRGVFVRNRLIKDDVVPNNIKNAVCQLACDIKTSAESEESDDVGFAIKRTKTDVLETEYAVGIHAQKDSVSDINKLAIYLKDYINGTFGQTRVIA